MLLRKRKFGGANALIAVTLIEDSYENVADTTKIQKLFQTHDIILTFQIHDNKVKRSFDSNIIISGDSKA